MVSNSNCTFQNCLNNCCNYYGSCPENYPGSPERYSSCYYRYLDSSDKPLDDGTIIAIVFASVAALLLLCLVAWMCKRRGDLQAESARTAEVVFRRAGSSPSRSLRTRRTLPVEP